MGIIIKPGRFWLAWSPLPPTPRLLAWVQSSVIDAIAPQWDRKKSLVLLPQSKGIVAKE